MNPTTFKQLLSDFGYTELVGLEHSITDITDTTYKVQRVERKRYNELHTDFIFLKLNPFVGMKLIESDRCDYEILDYKASNGLIYGVIRFKQPLTTESNEQR